MLAAGDPVGSGIISNLARPRGNITGTSLDSPELAGKRLQLLKQMLPGIATVAVLWNEANSHSALMFAETEAAGRTLGMRILLPAMYCLREFVDAGSLLSYDPSLVDLSRRVAQYVDKILKGAKPRDLPIEQPTSSSW